ncbi:MAG: hypothetical protein ABL876_04035 [Chitinophagaceae bacterium]
MPLRKEARSQNDRAFYLPAIDKHNTRKNAAAAKADEVNEKVFHPAEFMLR